MGPTPKANNAALTQTVQSSAWWLMSLCSCTEGFFVVAWVRGSSGTKQYDSNLQVRNLQVRIFQIVFANKKLVSLPASDLVCVWLFRPQWKKHDQQAEEPLTHNLNHLPLSAMFLFLNQKQKASSFSWPNCWFEGQILLFLLLPHADWSHQHQHAYAS
ncbi:MAG: hypothetical protein MI749_22335 [Desulfovibrionales bacterium]|nr:hypothetical protein [Desulfovibrionales bacterium]